MGIDRFYIIDLDTKRITIRSNEQLDVENDRSADGEARPVEASRPKDAAQQGPPPAASIRRWEDAALFRADESVDAPYRHPNLFRTMDRASRLSAHATRARSSERTQASSALPGHRG
jgi:hypothetical protein